MVTDFMLQLWKALSGMVVKVDGMSTFPLASGLIRQLP